MDDDTTDASPEDLRENLARWNAYAAKWKRWTVILFVIAVISTGAVVPLLRGFPLHRHFQQFRFLIWVAWAALSAFVTVAAQTFLWIKHVRALRAEYEQKARFYAANPDD